MYAIFENGSKQYKASVGDLVKVEKLKAEVGATVTFPVVLTSDENGIAVGTDAAKLAVTCEVVSHGKDKKIIVFKYKAKKNERKKQGHRQPFTQVKVTAIGVAAEKPETETAKKPAAKKAAPKADAETEKKPAAKKPASKAATADTAEKKPAVKKTATKAATDTAAKKPAAKKATAEKKED